MSTSQIFTRCSCGATFQQPHLRARNTRCVACDRAQAHEAMKLRMFEAAPAGATRDGVRDQCALGEVPPVVHSPADCQRRWGHCYAPGAQPGMGPARRAVGALCAFLAAFPALRTDPAARAFARRDRWFRRARRMSMVHDLMPLAQRCFQRAEEADALGMSARGCAGAGWAAPGTDCKRRFGHQYDPRPVESAQSLVQQLHEQVPGDFSITIQEHPGRVRLAIHQATQNQVRCVAAVARQIIPAFLLLEVEYVSGPVGY